ncbi:hypothetical protein, partial [Burkholderia multivorans]|uniref:hypothetical protein n=1 Tax=Burkholderia multivorans TaxID=87883 RepID=UPI001E5C0DDD
FLIDGPLSKAARAEVDRKYRATSDLPCIPHGYWAAFFEKGLFQTILWLKKWLKRRLVALLVKLNFHLKQ